MNYTEINEQLDKLYKEKWAALSAELIKYNATQEEKNKKASYPFLLKLGEHFDFDFNNRGKKRIIMCFGQESNGGKDEFSTDQFKRNNSIINEKDICKEYIGKLDHRWCDVIAHKWLKKKSQILFDLQKDNVYVIWNNIRKISTVMDKKTRGKINNKLKNILNQYFNVIPQELEIIKPDFLFFCTGPGNDPDIEQFVGTMENPNPPYIFSTAKGEGNLCRFTVNGYTAIRGYYPINNSTYWKNQKKCILENQLFSIKRIE